MTAIGDEIRRLRLAQGLSQEALVAVLAEEGFDADSSAISRIESGKRMPRVDESAVIAGVLGISLDALFGLQMTERKKLAQAYQSGYYQAMRDVSDYARSSFPDLNRSQP